MDFLQLINEAIDKSIDALSLVKLLKNELVRVSNENINLKQEIVGLKEQLEEANKGK